VLVDIDQWDGEIMECKPATHDLAELIDDALDTAKSLLRGRTVCPLLLCLPVERALQLSACTGTS
jgi:hypothetical protein